jgi:hypothetical protein
MKIHDGPKVWVPYKDQMLQWMFIFSSLSPCKSSMATLRSVDIRPPSLLLSGMIPFPRRERLSLPFFLFFFFFFEFLVDEREQGSQMDGPRSSNGITTCLSTDISLLNRERAQHETGSMLACVLPRETCTL